jgi:hypothetical protein
LARFTWERPIDQGQGRETAAIEQADKLAAPTAAFRSLHRPGHTRLFSASPAAAPKHSDANRRPRGIRGNESRAALVPVRVFRVFCGNNPGGLLISYKPAHRELVCHNPIRNRLRLRFPLRTASPLRCALRGFGHGSRIHPASIPLPGLWGGL